ncbi:MAG TPA: sigma-54 dependent transcriptional regulator [Blastocatellia bacterium]|nr:sigma-54 dependent transcriptional regulator [Blastocatellia bacterium]HMX26109.1 sigma-54 dependent transcriptional regulator [Blastocatellia bacterium]HNG29908.1 sigma-54 dependent transcriptional regulator [Blastocatellia bacterium]
MPKEKILVVDDDVAVRYTLAEALTGWGYEPIEAATVAAALDAFDAERPLAVLQDIHLPDGSGLDALLEYKKRQPQAIVIMITGSVQLDDTITALRGGAHDFISKPVRLSELQVTIRNGIETGKLRREVGQFRRQQEQRFGFSQIVGQSSAMMEMIALARKVAASEASSVLLQGESGTGKDVVAKAIHYGSTRAEEPFIAINCAAIPGTLIESELFGHEKGAFTDARARKEGLFEQAQGGTLFLDEIGELELGLQAKLLRVLEEGAFRRVGGLKDLPLDVRVIAASNRNLKLESEAGRFRLDLYYRLSVIQIDLPPLRERGDDVLLLAGVYIKRFNEHLRKRIRGLSPEVEAIFRQYQWPGNVRELRNVVERVMILEDASLVTTAWLPRDLVRREPTGALPTAVNATAPVVESSAPLFRLPEHGTDLEQVELSLVRQAMERSGGNQTRAAELLGISRDQLRYRLKKLEEVQPEL